MIDPEQYIKTLCEDCGTHHSQLESCPYDAYVAAHYNTTLGPITPAFFKNVWKELTEKERERYA